MTASTQDSPGPEPTGKPPAFALINPDGTLEWRPLDAESDVMALIGGKYGADIAKGAWVGPATETPTASLRFFMSDVALVFADDYAPNPKAREVLIELSEGRVIQQVRGIVALCEFDKDSGGEVGFPQEMSADTVQRITDLHGA